MAQKKHPSLDLKESIVKQITENRIGIMEASREYGFHRNTIRGWVQEFEDNSGFLRERQIGSGRKRKLSGEIAEQLTTIIQQPASRFGFENDLWDTKRLEIICRKQLNVTLSHMAVWRFLKSIDYSCKKVKKVYTEVDQKQKDIWIVHTVKEIKKTVKKHNAVLYFEDESNISLQPVMGKTWAKRGEKVFVQATSNRGSLAVISAISNDGRLVFQVFKGSKRFKSEDIINFLSQLLERHQRRHVVVVMDQAPCHKSKKVRDFIQEQTRLHVFYLPARCPDLNPDEQVWNHLKNKDLKNHQETNLEGLAKKVKKKMKNLSESPKKLMGVFRQCNFSKLYL